MSAAANPSTALLVSGPTAAGKSAALVELRFLAPPERPLGIIERDVLAEMGGRRVVTPGTPAQAANWDRSLRQLMVLARDFLEDGCDVVIASHVSPWELEWLQNHLYHHQTVPVGLLPSWDVLRARRERRIAEQRADSRATAELSLFGWDDHRQLYEQQTEMAQRGLFAHTIDNSDLTPAQVARQLLAVLGGSCPRRPGDLAQGDQSRPYAH
jgi:hypothetical protein